jgi:predicted acylesterase/phospholipase RssA
VRWAETLKWQDVVSLLDVSLRGGLIKGQKLIDFFERNFVDRDFTELDQRFACVATELCPPGARSGCTRAACRPRCAPRSRSPG